jgi:hypothetical protein
MYLWCWEVYVIFSVSIFLCNCLKMCINTYLTHFFIENFYLSINKSYICIVLERYVVLKAILTLGK